MYPAGGPLTKRQLAVLDFITTSLKAQGVAPTLQEIADAFGYSSTASAQKHVNQLVSKGYLQRERHRKRGLVPVTNAVTGWQEGVSLPLLGIIAAGQPIEALPDPQTVTVPAVMVGGGEHYVLRVRGDSMIGDGILDGDLVVIRAGAAARDGDTAVALIDGEVTLKRVFFGDDGSVRLQPANPAMAALLVAADRVEIQGVLVALLRRFT
jgi:repressor LexA